MKCGFYSGWSSITTVTSVSSESSSFENTEPLFRLPIDTCTRPPAAGQARHAAQRGTLVFRGREVILVLR